MIVNGCHYRIQWMVWIRSALEDLTVIIHLQRFLRWCHCFHGDCHGFQPESLSNFRSGTPTPIHLRGGSRYILITCTHVNHGVLHPSYMNTNDNDDNDLYIIYISKYKWMILQLQQLKAPWHYLIVMIRMFLAFSEFLNHTLNPPNITWIRHTCLIFMSISYPCFH